MVSSENVSGITAWQLVVFLESKYKLQIFERIHFTPIFRDFLGFVATQKMSNFL